jgi:hypothetical protein
MRYSKRAQFASPSGKRLDVRAQSTPQGEWRTSVRWGVAYGMPQMHATKDDALARFDALVQNAQANGWKLVALAEDAAYD